MTRSRGCSPHSRRTSRPCSAPPARPAETPRCSSCRCFESADCPRWARSPASLRRRLAWLERDRDVDAAPLQQTLAFDDADELGQDEHDGLTADVGIDSRQERARIRRLVVLADAARRHESKAKRAVSLVRRFREPVILFTEFRDSLEVLRRLFGAGHDGRLSPRRSVARRAPRRAGAVSDGNGIGPDRHRRRESRAESPDPRARGRQPRAAVESRPARAARRARGPHRANSIRPHHAPGRTTRGGGARGHPPGRAHALCPPGHRRRSHDATFASEAAVRACAIAAEPGDNSAARRSGRPRGNGFGLLVWQRADWRGSARFSAAGALRRRTDAADAGRSWPDCRHSSVSPARRSSSSPFLSTTRPARWSSHIWSACACRTLTGAGLRRRSSTRPGRVAAQLVEPRAPRPRASTTAVVRSRGDARAV